MFYEKRRSLVCNHSALARCGKTHDLLCGSLNYLLVFLNFRVTKADDILPAAAGKKTYCMMETIMLIRLFNINLYTPIIKQMRIYDLGMVVHGEKWVHHKLHSLLSRC